MRTGNGPYLLNVTFTMKLYMTQRKQWS